MDLNTTKARISIFATIIFIVIGCVFLIILFTKFDHVSKFNWMGSGVEFQEKHPQFKIDTNRVTVYDTIIIESLNRKPVKTEKKGKNVSIEVTEETGNENLKHAKPKEGNYTHNGDVYSNAGDVYKNTGDVIQINEPKKLLSHADLKLILSHVENLVWENTLGSELKIQYCVQGGAMSKAVADEIELYLSSEGYRPVGNMCIDGSVSYGVKIRYNSSDNTINISVGNNI